ncbi:hypothetical protein V5O48_006780 [Marasmius crinis-equi]|uniref:Trafficking protein particle complex subunit 12 n=1 Tax=Marasmius crinis-equi TaxID=585013 RepID=A0ABR3FII4_9AGAR
MPNRLHKPNPHPHESHHVAFPSSDSSSTEESSDNEPSISSKPSMLKGLKRGLQRVRSFSSTKSTTPKPVPESPPRTRRESMKSLARAVQSATHVILPTSLSPSKRRRASQSRVVSLPPPTTIILDNDPLPEFVPESLPESIPEVNSEPVSPQDPPMATPSEDRPEHEQEAQPEVQEQPPSIYVEPEVPDPFLIDEPESSASEGEDEAQESSTVPDSLHTAPITIDETAPVSPSSVVPLTPVDVNKDVPPPPSESEAEVETEEAPELYIPGLVLPLMFLPIPNTDPLTTLLNKYIYPPDKRPARDLTGEWQNSNFHAMVMTNSWRALARMARDRIVTTDPDEIALILGVSLNKLVRLWYLRLACLSRLRLFNQTTVECNNLFSVLNGIESPEAKAWVFDRLLPFEIEVMQARLKYWAGDHMAYLDELNFLLKKCKTKARNTKTDATTVAMWKERGARICLIIASQLMEMKVPFPPSLSNEFPHSTVAVFQEFGAACKLLESLLNQEYESSDLSSPALRSAIARIYLQSGHLSMAKKHIDLVDKDTSVEQTVKDMNRAFLASANGDWETASRVLQRILEGDAENFAAVNNLSVALLSQGKLKESIEVLEKALKASPSSVVVAEPFLFNLSTLYELRSTTATQKKLELLIEVAKWSGDGLKIACLKMPSN